MEYVTRDRLYLMKNGKRVVVEAGKKIRDGDLSERNIANKVATGALTPVAVAAADEKAAKRAKK